MKQSPRMSFVETAISVAIGFVLAFITNAIVMPLFGHPITTSDNIYITLIFTAISLARAYLVRRGFERFRRDK